MAGNDKKRLKIRTAIESAYGLVSFVPQGLSSERDSELLQVLRQAEEVLGRAVDMTNQEGFLDG